MSETTGDAGRQGNGDGTVHANNLVTLQLTTLQRFRAGEIDERAAFRASRGRSDEEEAAEPPLRQIITVLQQVMCTHDAEKLAISVLEVYGDGYREERSSK